jgi:phosphate-selective porin OprO/OprP
MSLVFVGTLIGAAPDARAQQAALPDGAPAVEFTWADKPSLTFGDRLRVDFRGRFQSDFTRSEASTNEDGDLGDIEKKRIGFEGSVGKLFDFEVSRELDSSRPWRDAYVDYRQFDVVRVQAGRFKVPFSLDENTGGGNLDFANRSMAATALAPGRDQGVMVHGRLWGRLLSYEAGLFTHDGDNARVRDELSSAAGRTAALRLSTAIGGKSGVHAAVAVASSDVPTTIWTIRGRTALGDTFFPSALWIQGQRRRFGLEARWAGGPVSLQSEYMRLTQERRDQGVMGDLAPAHASGWYVSGTWAVTGERKGRKIQTQAPSVFKGGRGAVELAVRLEELTFGDLNAAGASLSPRAETVLGNHDRALTLGVNWYLSPNLKLQGNAIRDALFDATRGPLPAKPSYWSSVLRLQVAM